MTLDQLAAQPCLPRRGAEHLLDAARLDELLALLPGWQRSADGLAIGKDFKFSDFHHTLGFANAVGFLANQADHHPDLQLGYGHCHVWWSTHDCAGVSMNDAICAARTERLLHR